MNSRTANALHGRSGPNWTRCRLNYQDLEDLELLAKISEKDRDALATLYDRYGRRVFALAVRMLNDPVGSEEVTQDVFMSVWRRGATYTTKKVFWCMCRLFRNGGHSSQHCQVFCVVLYASWIGSSILFYLLSCHPEQGAYTAEISGT